MVNKFQKRARAGTIRRKNTYVTKTELKRQLKTFNDLEHAGINSGGVISVPVTPYITKLTNIPQGDQIGHREGIKIQNNGLDMRMVLTKSDNINVIRVIIFQWKNDDNTVSPLDSDILQTLSSSIAPISAINRQTMNNDFKVLYDRTTTLTSGQDVKYTRINIKPQRMLKYTTYNNSANTGNNQLYILLQSDSGVASHPTVYFYGWYKFYSM